MFVLLAVARAPPGRDMRNGDNTTAGAGASGGTQGVANSNRITPHSDHTTKQQAPAPPPDPEPPATVTAAKKAEPAPRQPVRAGFMTKLVCAWSKLHGTEERVA